MVSKKKITISWSGGKDSAFALYKILLSGDYEVTGLHTVINEGTRRVGMHGVREDLMDRQADAMGLPLTKLYLDSSEDHDAYIALMQEYYARCVTAGIEAVMFGDIFLEDLKRFREDLLASSGLKAIYPVWRDDTRTLIRDFIDAGFKTTACAANALYFSEAQMGRTIDHDFIAALPPQVDPCGENGEFHTFVFDGPIFKRRVDLERGEVVKKVYTYKKTDEQGNVATVHSAFWFQDLLPDKMV